MSATAFEILSIPRPPRPWLRAAAWFAGAVLLVGWTDVSLAAGPPEEGSPFFQEVTREFRTMTSTRYQHKTEVDRAAGGYHYDCVGFVSYALRLSAPQAWASVTSVCGIRKGYFPSPPTYQSFFAGLADTPRPGWQSIAKVSELRPGDVVSWDHKTETAVGHAIVIADAPRAEGEGIWVVEVYDSTGSPHQDDSRPGDTRSHPVDAGGAHSGLGHGVMALIADPASGALTGYRWSPKGKTVVAPIAAARPTS